MKRINGPGVFLAKAARWSLQPSSKSPSIGLWIEFVLSREYPTMGQPIDLAEELQAEGTFWLIGKTGEINDAQYRRLMAVLEWDGRFETLDPASGWVPAVCRVEIEGEPWKGQQRWRAGRVHYADGTRYTDSPAVEEAEMQELRNRYSALFAAAAAAVKAGQPIPRSSPVSQVPPSSASGPPSSEIPF